MKRQCLFLLFAFLSLILFTACATRPIKTLPPFDTQPIQGQWVPKADNLYFVLDASSSMLEPYGDYAKIDIAKAVVANFNQTMPDLKIKAALRGFGFSPAISSQGTLSLFGPRDYNRTGLAEGLKTISEAGGPSPMGKALTAAAADLKESHGKVAMVIISDGKDMGKDEMAAANALVSQMPDRLCLYTVLVGDAPEGKTLLGKIAGTSKCGKVTSADTLASGAGMAAFVQDVLLARQGDSDGDGVPDSKDRCANTPSGVKVDAQGCPLDTDGDGVPDYLDKCPGTPAGVKVDAQGCPLDTDGDGVPDYFDKCPGTPSGVKVDVRGCALDTDGDGVPDYFDKCPGTPAGVEVDTRGCPVDTDGDGVPNYLDKCPGTPAGVKVDARGCPPPVATKSAEVTSAGTWIYKDVQFDINKDILKAVSYPVLNEIAEGLKAQPSIKVEVQGHTDSTGKADYNQRLSERRAQSVVKYLIYKGIAAERLIPKGYGLTSPIATNKTEEGRTRNRRVELKPLQ